MVLVQNKYKNTGVGFLRTQITWVKPYHLSAKCMMCIEWEQIIQEFALDGAVMQVVSGNNWASLFT